ncbi:hypothetical protein LV564_16280 [Komagataeibacter nataicola]|nr:hypothetical protein [Komagataeibacter nataicola]WEQ55600.1 hypothetical protein LV564_16280 [Komagataeibacter nataicola]WNM09528.1 hypothetical protein RI056_06170 [Komagataeibacter nataicola]
MTDQSAAAPGLAGLLWPRRNLCYRRLAEWLIPDMRWMERPGPLDI